MLLLRHANLARLPSHYMELVARFIAEQFMWDMNGAMAICRTPVLLHQVFSGLCLS